MDTKRVVNVSGITELIAGQTLKNHLLLAINDQSS